jgi:hypothetical protein
MKYSFALLSALLITMSGCSDNQPHDWFTQVVVLDAVTGLGVGEVEFVLVSMSGNHFLGAPVATDEDGSLSVRGLEEGRYAWVVLPGQGWAMARPPVEAALFSTATPTVPYLDSLKLLAIGPGGAPRVSGTVVDAQTGDPIAGVAVGLPGWPEGWDGWLLPSTDITDEAGEFLVHDVPFVADPSGGETFMLWPLVFQAEGYDPVAVKFDPPSQYFEEVQAGTIEMQASVPGTGGALTGLVLFGDEPVPGVEVVANWTGVTDKTWLGHPGLTTVTNNAGRFVFEDLVPGSWAVEPAYLPDDGWIIESHLHGVNTVLAGETTETDVLSLLRSVRPVYPMPGTVRVDSLPVFQWHAVAEADSYDVYVGRWALGRTHLTEMSIPEEFPLTAGTWFWVVRGVRMEDEIAMPVALSETLQYFVVGPFDN